MISPSPDQGPKPAQSSHEHLAQLYELSKQVEQHITALRAAYALGTCCPDISAQPTICRLETAASTLRTLFPA